MKNQTQPTSLTERPDVQRHRWWILGAVGMFTFMSTLDASIVNIALPVMSRDLKVPMNQAEWVVSIYLIIICALLLLFGKLGDVLGKINVFRVGTLLFVLGSFLAGFNNSFALLLVARTMQASGAAMTMANNNGIITEIFPFGERGKALGTIGSFVALGAIAGPGLGGIILAHLSWGYIFWINVPVGLVTMLIGAFIFPKDTLRSGGKIDIPGTTLFALGMVTLFGGIFLGQEFGFTNPWILGSFVLAIITLTSFYFVDKRVADPLVRFDIFKNGRFTISLLTALLIFMTNLAFNVILPFYLENARGLAPNIAGYIMMIFPLIQIVAAPVSGGVSDRVGPEKITIIGLIFLTLVQLGYLFIGLNTSFGWVAGIIALVGLGNGMFQAPNNTIIMSSVSTKELGIAGGLNALSRNMGMVLGVSFSTTVLFSAMSHKTGTHVTTYLPKQPEVFIYGMHVTFAVSLVICLIALVLTAYRFRKNANKKEVA